MLAEREKCNRFKVAIEIQDVNGETAFLAYFIFVNFFTQPQFEFREFYTRKRVNARQKLSHDKTA